MFESRSRVLLYSIIATGLIFILRLLYIQVFDSDYKIFAQNNALRKIIITPARGLVYDRKGKILINNEMSYDIMVTPSKLKNFNLDSFCKIIDIDTLDINEQLQKAISFSKFRTSVLVKGISIEQHAKIIERLYRLPGLSLEMHTTRTYPQSSAAHVLGYLGEAKQELIDSSDGYYRMGDYVGVSGLESVYEKELRGTKGVRNILVDVLNREQGSYQNGKMDISAIAGMDLNTSIDLELQEYGELLMKGRKGSIIAIEPSTGEILAMVSVPAYNPNLLLGRKRNSNYYRLMKDKGLPLFNRAINAKYPPGSTFKPAMALLSLQEGLIGPGTVYPCNGGYRIGNRIIKCHSPGSYDLHGSIMMSCNSYYCYVFRGLIDQKRFKNSTEALDDWNLRLQKFGLGSRLGVDITGEIKGYLPASKFYNKRYGLNKWKSGTIISLGIGQGEVTFTPLQIANMSATIANKGYYITPHFVRSFDKNGKTLTKEWDKFYTGIDSNYFNLIRNAMQSVVDHGTAILAKIPGVEVCGKTGTAQNPHGEDHSIFMGFAPRIRPKIAICVVIENAGFGGVWAAPVGGLMMEKYLKDSIKDAASIWSEKRILDFGNKLAYSQSLSDSARSRYDAAEFKRKQEELKNKLKEKDKKDKLPSQIIDTSKIRESTGED